MMGSWRPLALAAALNLVAGTGIAAAQSVIVRYAPPGATIELVLNSATVGSATADSQGNATVTAEPSARLTKPQTTARVYVDACGSLQRVLVVERGVAAPPRPEACERREIAGLYTLRPVTAFFVELRDTGPRLWLRQGSIPQLWLEEGPGRSDLPGWTPVPRGLTLSGGSSLGQFSDTVWIACGNVGGCDGDGLKFTYSGGATYWIRRFVAAEVSYVRPGRVTAQGSDFGYNFDSFLDTQIVTIAGLGGVPVGPVRLYGKFGANHSWATFSTTNTINDRAFTIGGTGDDGDNGEPQTITIRGGTQTFEQITKGWGWIFGGGIEGWVSPSVALYGEITRAALKGMPLDEEFEGRLNERASFFVFGLRLRLGG
jgi:hypothetical protein